MDAPLSRLSKTLQHLLAGGVGASAEGGGAKLVGKGGDGGQGVRVGMRGGSGGRVVWSAEEQGWWRHLALLRRAWTACRPLPLFETSCAAASHAPADCATRDRALSGLLAVRRLDTSGLCLCLFSSLSVSFFLSLSVADSSVLRRAHTLAHSLSQRMQLLPDAQETRGSTTTYMPPTLLFLGRDSPALAALAPLALG
jgi:hypothetical protein